MRRSMDASTMGKNENSRHQDAQSNPPRGARRLACKARLLRAGSPGTVDTALTYMSGRGKGGVEVSGHPDISARSLTNPIRKLKNPQMSPSRS